MNRVNRSRGDVIGDILILLVFILFFNIKDLGKADARVWSDLLVSGYMFYLGLSGADKRWSMLLSVVTGILLEIVLVLCNHMTTMDFLRTGIAIMQPIRSNVILLTLELILVNLINYTIGSKVRGVLDKGEEKRLYKLKKKEEEKGTENKKRKRLSLEEKIDLFGYVVILLVQVLFIFVLAILYLLKATGAGVGYTIFDVVNRNIVVSVLIEGVILLLLNVKIKKRESVNEKGNVDSPIIDNDVVDGLCGEQRVDSEGNKV